MRRSSVRTNAAVAARRRRLAARGSAAYLPLILVMATQLLLIFGIGTAGAAVTLEQWLAEHPRNYTAGSAEYSRRAAIFAQNSELIARHNSNPNATTEWGYNQFSDLTADEFRARLALQVALPPLRVTAYPVFTGRGASTPPASSVDWRTTGKVTHVKNQGGCGSCWAFSATGCLESARAIAHNFSYHGKHDELQALSEQELMDCAYPADHGCKGGSFEHAWEYTNKHGGLCSEEAYPYKHKGEACHQRTCAVVCGTASHKVTRVHESESALMAAVALQPVSVGVDAKAEHFQHYKSGVITGSCGTKLDHAVLVIGYGTDKGVSYWIVKNSWGDKWGEKGYVKLKRGIGGKGQCGILATAAFTSVKREACAPVETCGQALQEKCPLSRFRPPSGDQACLACTRANASAPLCDPERRQAYCSNSTNAL